MSAARDDGGSAYPMQDHQAIHAVAAAAVLGIEDTDERDAVYIKARATAVGGMSLRDHFAANVLNGIIARKGEEVLPENVESVAFICYQIADAMLKERSK